MQVQQPNTWLTFQQDSSIHPVFRFSSILYQRQTDAAPSCWIPLQAVADSISDTAIWTVCFGETDTPAYSLPESCARNFSTLEPIPADIWLHLWSIAWPTTHNTIPFKMLPYDSSVRKKISVPAVSPPPLVSFEIVKTRVFLKILTRYASDRKIQLEWFVFTEIRKKYREMHKNYLPSLSVL